MIEGIVELSKPYYLDPHMTFFKDEAKTKVEVPDSPSLTPNMLLDIAATAAKMKSQQLGDSEEEPGRTYEIVSLKYRIDGQTIGLSCREDETYILSYADDTYINLTLNQAIALKDLLERVVTDNK